MRKILGLIILIVLTVSGCGEKANEDTWYDYGNGMVNLSRVTHLSSKMSFKLITKKLTDNEKMGLAVLGMSEPGIMLVENLPITQANIDKIEEGLEKNKGKWESVRYSAEINFDAFTLKLNGFEGLGLECTDDGCIDMTEHWLKRYEDVKICLNKVN